MNILKKIQYKLFREGVKHRFIRKSMVSTYNFLVTNADIELLKEKTYDIENEEKLLNELKQKGHTSVFNIKKEVYGEIIEELKKHQPYGLGEDKTYTIDFNNPKKPNEDVIIYQYRDVQKWSVVQKIIKDPQINKVAKGYLQNNPIVQNVYVWWSFPASKENLKKNSSNYGWHYDIDNFKFVKIFTNLVDVDLETGPHKIYSDTHKRKSFFQKKNRRLTDKQAEEQFSKEQLQIMTGKAGTSFFEDTLCYHKGTNPMKPRLLFQIEFSLTNYKIG